MPVKSRKKVGENSFSLISREKLLALYAGLLRCRLLEGLVRMRLGKPSLRHSRIGHEAPAVALSIDLERKDTITAAPGDFLPGFIKEKDVAAALAELRVKSRSPFSARLKAALAAARIHQGKSSAHIAVVFCPASAVQSRVWRQALLAAGDERLPILFVSDYVQNGDSLPRLKFPAITVDRDDVVALYRVASEAMAHARRGNGATLIECMGWQPEDTQECPSDPIANMEAYLEQRGISFARTRAKIVTAVGRKSKTAR